MLNLIIFGPPGCGKGTQSARLSCRFELVHLSTGDIFREKVRQGSDLGSLLSGYMNKGELVPDGIVLREIYMATTTDKEVSGYIFDGFPRTIMQAVALDRIMGERNSSLDIVFSMKVEKDELLARLLGRGEDSGRADDSSEIILKRINVYEQYTLPVKDYYVKQGKLVQISGMAPVKVVSDRMAAVVDFYRKNGVIPEVTPL